MWRTQARQDDEGDRGSAAVTRLRCVAVTHVSCQTSSPSSVQIRMSSLRRPLAWVSSTERTADASITWATKDDGDSSRSRAMSAIPLAEPRVEGHPEACLGPVDDRRREAAPGHLLDQPLRRPVMDLQVARQAERRLDQLVVQERRAQLDRGGHRHAVTALEQVVRAARPRGRRAASGRVGRRSAAPIAVPGGRRPRPSRRRRSSAVNGANQPTSRSVRVRCPERAGCDPRTVQPWRQRARRARESLGHARPGARGPGGRRPPRTGASGSRRTARRCPPRTGRPSRAWPASSARRWTATSAGSDSGASRCQVRRDQASANSSGRTTTSWCVVPRWSATVRAWCSSSTRGSPNPAANVCRPFRAAKAGDRRHDEAAVDAAAEVGANGDVGDQCRERPRAPAPRARGRPPRRARRPARSSGPGGDPVAVHRGPARQLRTCSQCAGGQLANALVHGARGGDRPSRQVVVQARPRRPRRGPGMATSSDLTSEAKRSASPTCA